MKAGPNASPRAVERIVGVASCWMLLVSLLFLSATFTTHPSPWSVGAYPLAVAVTSLWIWPLRRLVGPRASQMPVWLAPALTAAALTAIGAAMASLPNILPTQPSATGISTPAEAPRSPR